MGAEISACQKNLENVKLRSKDPSRSQNNISASNSQKFHNFTEILTENSPLQKKTRFQKTPQALVQALESRVRPLFGRTYACPLYTINIFEIGPIAKKLCQPASCLHICGITSVWSLHGNLPRKSLPFFRNVYVKKW